MEMTTIVLGLSVAATAITVWKVLERHLKSRPPQTSNNPGKWLERMASQLNHETNPSQLDSSIRISRHPGEWLEKMAADMENDPNPQMFVSPSRTFEDTDAQVEELIRETKKALVEDFDEYYNFAICGQAGTGKNIRQFNALIVVNVS